MAENDKLEKDVKTKEASLEETRQKLIQLTAEYQTGQRELNQKIVDMSKEEFADVDITKLLVNGVTYHESKIVTIPFRIRTLTKKESLDVDKRSKAYFEEAAVYYSNSVMVDTLAYSVVSYNNAKTLFDPAVDGSFERAKEAVGSLSEEVLLLIWNVYNRLNRYLRAYLEINLKN